MSYIGLLPLTIIVITAFVAMFLDLLAKPNVRLQSGTTILGLLLAVCACPLAWSPQGHTYWNGIYTADPLALVFTALAALTGALVLMFSTDCLMEKKAYPGEFVTLVPFVVIGLAVACSTKELLTFFIAFEIMSLPLYVMAAWKRFSTQSAEAGFKYFITGAVSSAIMLYGISFIFGATGSTFFDTIVTNYTNFDGNAAPRSAFILGALMLAAGMCFKIAAAPFHMWAPDVYEGSPSPAGMFISTAPKATMIAVLLRTAWDLMAIQSLDFRLEGVWLLILTAIAIMSMCWGNLAALLQTNIKRLMAYSGIAQIGYTLLGVMAASRHGDAEAGAAAAIFYIGLYSFANLAAWAVIIIVEWQTGRSAIADYKGLAKRSPFLAFTLLFALLSLAGAPPLAGFIGKFFIFRSVWVAQNGWWWVALIGIINSVISLYYYFGVLKQAYFDDAPDNNHTQLRVPCLTKVGIVVCLAAITVVSLCPQLFQLALAAGKVISSSAP